MCDSMYFQSQVDHVLAFKNEQKQMETFSVLFSLNAYTDYFSLYGVNSAWNSLISISSNKSVEISKGNKYFYTCFNPI